MTSLFVILAFTRWSWFAIRLPLRVLRDHVYCMVRDQKYLIGKKLRSIPPKHADESSEEALLNS